MRANRVPRLRRVGVAALSLGLVAAAACGSDDKAAGSGTGSGKLPSTIKLVSINPETGPAAFAGLAANKGYELAIEEINTQKFLGDTKVVLQKQDTAGKAQTAASQLTSAVADKAVAAVFGSVSSDQAVAMSPIAEKSRIPIIYTQAGSPGVVIGDYTYRVTPPMSSYYPRVGDFIQSQKVKTLGVVYAAWSPTLKEIGEKTLPDMGKELGFQVVASVGTQQTTQDFAAPISQVLAKKPDAVALLLVGASNPTAMKQLRQAGYSRPVLGNSGASAGNLKPAGKDGAGMVWPVDFHYQQEGETTQKFVQAYQAKYNETPLNYAAEAYDAAWLFARAVKEAGSASRSDIQKSLDKVTAQGFQGAMGELKFEGRDLRLPGVVVQWDGTKEVVLDH
jgi:branched-chain amino acid transport system substrate-binding protein